MTAGLDHRCAAPGCGAWGSYGEGVKLKAGKLGTWWCSAHRPPRLDPARKPEPAAAPAGVQAARNAGRLL